MCFNNVYLQIPAFGSISHGYIAGTITWHATKKSGPSAWRLPPAQHSQYGLPFNVLSAVDYSSSVLAWNSHLRTRHVICINRNRSHYLRHWNIIKRLRAKCSLFLKLANGLAVRCIVVVIFWFTTCNDLCELVNQLLRLCQLQNVPASVNNPGKYRPYTPFIIYMSYIIAAI